MGTASFAQGSFLSGEWSKTAQGNIADPAYKFAMNVSLNGLPVASGAWMKRPGTVFGQHTRLGAAGRVMSFAFQQDAPYTIELTSGYMRFFGGSSLLMTDDVQTVLGISTANPAVMRTSGPPDWATGDTVIFQTVGTADPLLLNRQFTATRIDPSHFSLVDPLTGLTLDGSTLLTFVSATVARVMEVQTPYTGPLWQTVRLIQSDGAALLLDSSVAPQVLSIATDKTETAPATFSLDPATFEDGPYLDPVTNGAVLTATATSGLISLVIAFSAWSATRYYSLGDYVTQGGISYRSKLDANLNNSPALNPTYWESVPADRAIGPNGFVGTDIGRHIRLNSEPPLYASSASYAKGQTVTYGANTYWTSLIDANTGNIPGVDIVNWTINPTAANWTWGRITSLLNQVSGTTAGIAYIGTMTSQGGLAAAFNGAADQSSGQSAAIAAGDSIGPGAFVSVIGVLGVNLIGTAAGSRTITSVTLFPPTDVGFATRIISPATDSRQTADLRLSFELRASNIAPSDYNLSGTSLATGNFPTTLTGNSAVQITIGTSPITLVSSDQTTSWKYVWVNCVVSSSNIGPLQAPVSVFAAISQMAIFSAGSGSSAGVKLQVAGPPLNNTSAIRTWRLGLFNGASGWPTCGTTHEGRLWLSGSVKNRFDASGPFDDLTIPISFAPTKSDGTVTDSNGISYTLNSPDVNSILWMEPDQQGIIMGTEAGEWLVQATTLNSPLSPTNIQAHRVTRLGSSPVSTAKSIRTNNTVVFVHRYARALVEYFADVFSGKFTAPNLAEKAKHLTTPGVVEIAYQQETSPIIWARTADNRLLGCSYKRDSLMSSQGPTARGWHRHSLGGNYDVESISSGPSPDGTLDTLAMVIDVNNVRHVAFLQPLFEEGGSITDAWFVDDGVAVPTPVINISTANLGGLWHLNGCAVAVMASGLDMGNYTVAGGYITVPFEANPLFVAANAASYTYVVGLPYTADGQLVAPDTQPEGGARNGPGFGKIRRMHKFAVRLVDTQAISFGTDFVALSRLHAATLKTPGGTPVAANTLFTGIYKDTLSDDYEGFASQLCWRSERPFPATVATAGGFLETRDE